ncbi:MAG: AmmeMemoRadiSam system protein B [Terracidiphilus sp.]|jgi:AmmeMemoRadiSam system protein B/AmmeMemoRadiSam system protein A
MNFAMNSNAYWLAAPLLALLIFTPLAHANSSDAAKVRAAAVAGSFYPSDAKELSAMIDSLLAQVAEPLVTDPIIAAVAPHAGYPYSGPVAAYAYAALKGRKYSRVVIIAPTHYVAFNYTAIYEGDAYATPLGMVQVDKAFARQLVKMDSSLRLSSEGHEPTPAGGEHSVEVQLPWLQKVLGSFEIVPIVMGDQSYENSRALGLSLAKLIKSEGKEGETLVLASSDLSHYHTYDDAVRMDHKTLDALHSWDYFSMSRNFDSRIWEACGGAPIVAAMIYAERMGANQARILKYANSGDVTGDHARVVGYSADIFVKAANGKAAESPFSLSDHEKSELLALARKSVETAVQDQKLYEPAAIADATLNQERGAFVTLSKEGALRGCIGYTSAIKPLYITVRDTATLAATRDPRFDPVASSELTHLEYEISVLSPLRRVLDVEQIRIGEHGLLMKNGDSEGLLLPQVPVEQKWDRQTFLEQTCRKAKMDTGCWRDENTDIFSFTAVVFNEHKS